MRYPTLTTKDAAAYAALLTADPASANDTMAATFCAEWSRELSVPGSTSQRTVDLEPLAKVAAELTGVVKDPMKVDAPTKVREDVEGKFCGRVHAALAEVPYAILDDRRFWNYLAIRYFGEYIVWREKDALNKGNVGTYLDSNNRFESIPLRLFVRGQVALAADGTYNLAEAIEEGTDFWRSHILRVRTGRAPDLVGAFVRMHRDDRMITNVLRPFARLVNRMWANVVPHVYDGNEGEKLLDELRKRIPPK